MDSIVSLLPLEEAAEANRASSKAQHQGPAAKAAAAAAARAAGTDGPWSLAAELADLGEFYLHLQDDCRICQDAA